MNAKSGIENQDYKGLKKSILEIEARLSKLEALMSDSPVSSARPVMEEASIEINFERRENGEIESKIGEYGMAWLGNIVLLFGILFLVQFFKNQGHSLFSSLFGFVSVAGIYVLGYFLGRHHSYMSRLFTFNGHLLLFLVTLQMHFFTEDPLLANNFLGLFPVLIVIGAFVYLAFRNKSQVLSGIIMIMIVITALASNSTHVMLPLMIVISVLSLIFLLRMGWFSLLTLAIILVYATFLLWFFNNPIITKSLEAVSSLQLSYIYLSVCALLFSMVAILPIDKKISESQVNGSIILNGLGFSLLIALICVNFLSDNYYIILGVISAFSVAFSALLKSRGVLKLSAALYALYGFAILSITIGGIFKFPLSFLLLSVESMLVVSMALWFRSKFIVSMNVVMFIGLLTAYLLLNKPIYAVDISFAVAALVTARVLNWRRDRLDIKTDLIRNTYLLIGFVMTLVSLYRAVPDNYITFSWAMAAGLFFVLSLLLKNVKYRWLAIASMLSSAIYFFLFDLRQVSIGYRILALLVIAVISLSFSAYYAKKMKQNENETSVEQKSES